MWALIKAIPAGIATIKEVMGLIKVIVAFCIEHAEDLTRKDRIKTLKNGLKTAKKTGDTSEIESIFRGKK